MGEVDGGALVGQVLKEQKVKYLFVDQRRAYVADPRPAGRQRCEAHPHAARTGDGLRGRRLGSLDRDAGCLLRDRRLRPDQCHHGLALAALTNSAVVCLSGQHPHDRGRPRLVSGGLRLRHLRQLRQVHPARAGLEHASRSTCARLSGPPPARRRAWPWWRSPRTSSTAPGESPTSEPAPRSTAPTSCAPRAIPEPWSGRSSSCSAPSDRCWSAATGCSGRTPGPSCGSWPS